MRHRPHVPAARSAAQRCRALTGGSVETEIRFRRNGGEEVVERTRDPTRRLHELTAAALAAGEELDALEVRRPTLEDVYLELTRE